jgi:type III secretory pathway component EscS
MEILGLFLVLVLGGAVTVGVIVLFVMAITALQEKDK